MRLRFVTSKIAMFNKLFTSERLVYCANEANEQARALMREIMLDPDTVAQSTNSLLRPWTLAEIDEMQGSPSSSKMLNVLICLPPATTANDARDDVKPRESTDIAAAEKDEGQTKAQPIPIGTLSLDCPPVTRHHRSLTLGIMLAPRFQGKGYGTEAIRFALDWAFGMANAHAVRLNCFSYNKRALRVYDRMGFVREGVRRHSLFHDYEWHDHVLFSMLESEWAALNSERGQELGEVLGEEESK